MVFLMTSQLHVFCVKSRMIANLCLEIDLGYDEGILVVIDHDWLKHYEFS